MNSSNSSPKSQVYTLDKMKGKLSLIIKKLNLKAPVHFSPLDIQIVHWSLIAGLSYKEMTKESQTIIDQIIPEHKNELNESFLSSMEKKLNHLSELSNGAGLTFNDIPYLKGMRSFKDKLQKIGNNYEELKNLINTTPSLKKQIETPWSKISENIYARFLTKGSFGDIGFLQIRVISETGRAFNSESHKKYPLDIASLIANPNDSTIQPLSFSPLFGAAGVLGISQIVADPRIAALLVALTIAVQPMNWNDFFKLDELLKDVHDKNVQREIEKGRQILREEHNELEKPLRETGIVSGKTKDTSVKENDRVREYKKSGGQEQLEKDFEKIEGDTSKVDGLDLKTLPNGTKIIKRPMGSESGPTLEVQPPKNDPKYPDNKIRVKVRYL